MNKLDYIISNKELQQILNPALDLGQIWNAITAFKQGKISKSLLVEVCTNSFGNEFARLALPQREYKLLQRRAGRAVEYEKQMGRLKVEACKNCGRTEKRMEAHHWSYYRPLAIVWLCKKCHVSEGSGDWR